MNETRDRSFGAEARVLLIVVEDAAQRVLFNQHLKDTPHHLVFASDGEAAFDCFPECKPDIIIAHVNCPKLDGTVLCQLIRQQPNGDVVSLLLMGEPRFEVEKTQGWLHTLGADAYLELPFEPGQLEAALGPLVLHGRPKGSLESVVPRLESSGARPTEITFGSMLTDFMTQTDEGVVPVAKPGGDMDTVVAFQNPFFEGEGNAPLEVQSVAAPTPAETLPLVEILLVAPEIQPVPAESEPEIEILPLLEIEPAPPEPAAEDPVNVAGTAIIVPPLGLQERPTPVGPPPVLPGVRGVSSLTQVQPITESAIAPRPDAAVAFVNQMQTLNELDLQDPLQSSPKDPLEEPKISGSGTGIRPQPKAPENARLIEEQPREATPSDDQRLSEVQKRPAGQRRGLDESQLGKRLSKRVRTVHRLLDEVDYYQLLGIDRTADPEAMRSAYFDLSLEFHPDRFFLLRSGDLKEKIYEIYRRIAEAHRVLSDDRKRRLYDEAHEGSNSKRATAELRADSALPQPVLDPGTVDVTAQIAAVAETQQGLSFVDLAREAFSHGDFNGARLHLTFARAHEPENISLQSALQMVAGRSLPFTG